MKPNKPFTSISDKAMYDNRLSSTDFRIYTMICQHAFGKKTFSFPSQQTIADICDISRKTVNSSIKKLAELGYINPERSGKRKNNLYMITIFSTSDTITFIEKRKSDIKNKYSDVTQGSHHSNTSDVTILQSDVTIENSDVTFTSRVMSPQGYTNQYNGKQDNSFESKQLQNLISDEITPSEVSTEREGVGFTSGSVKSKEAGSVLVESSEVDSEDIKKAFELMTTRPPTGNKSKSTPSETFLELFRRIYEKKMDSSYVIIDLGKEMKHAHNIIEVLRSFYDTKLKDLYEKEFVLDPNFPPSVNFMFDIINHAFKNLNQWAYGTTPSMGLFDKNKQQIINSFLKGINSTLRNHNRHEIL